MKTENRTSMEELAGRYGLPVSRMTAPMLAVLRIVEEGAVAGAIMKITDLSYKESELVHQVGEVLPEEQALGIGIRYAIVLMLLAAVEEDEGAEQLSTLLKNGAKNFSKILLEDAEAGGNA